MFVWILKSAIVSVLFIFLIHHLIKFFKNMLTTPKIKDFVTRPAQKYERMFNAMNGGAQDGTTSLDDLFPSGGDTIGLNDVIGSFKLDENNTNNNPKKNNMKEELKQYLKSHLSDNGGSHDSLEPFSMSSSSSSAFTPF